MVPDGTNLNKSTVANGLRQQRSGATKIGEIPSYVIPPSEFAGLARAAGKGRGRMVAMFGTGAALLAVTGFFLLPRLQGGQSEHNESAKPPLRTVKVVLPEKGGGGVLTLPATLQPFQTTNIFARVSGYLKNWKADIGTRVKAGQVLAEIDTPELDAQLETARATLLKSQATLLKDQAQLVLADLDLGRSKELIVTKSITQQEFDTAEAQQKAAAATVQADQSTIKANQAEVVRLEALQSFQKVIAPFDGVITKRHAETGMLVAEGGASNSALFQIVQDDILRVQVQVPQTFAFFVKDGDPVKVIVPELAGQHFPAKVTRTANAVDPVSRTLTVEVELLNGDGKLLAGSYARVQLQGQQGSVLLIPANTLIMKVDGPHVAVVGSGQTIHMQKIQLGRDQGNKLEVVGGLDGHEQLVMNPAADLAVNEAVAVAQANGKAVAHK
jgi:RND family efflux transporter MFP subunit